MGVRVHIECVGCSRYGSAGVDTNYIYECGNCELSRLENKIKQATQQIWWIRILSWMTNRKPLVYNRENIPSLMEVL